MYKKTDSTQNSLIKQCLVLLEKSRERRKQGLFLVEGQREIQLAIRGGYELQTLLFCEEICSENSTKHTTKNTQIIEISLEVYQKLAYRKTTEGILAIVKTKELSAHILAANCGQTFEKIMKDFNRDHWMGAEESVAYGIVDGVI